MSWGIASGGSARGRSTREAVIVEVRTPTGSIGLGEAAPLPDLPGSRPDGSPDTIAIAERAIAAWAAAGAAMPTSVDEVRAAVASIGSPSARFGVETALLDAIARDRGVTLAELLVPAPGVAIPVSVVVDTEDEARSEVARGIRCLKIKVGSSGDLERVAAIAAAVPAARLRLDANRSWPTDSVRARMAALAGLNVEYIEEPCADAARLLDADLPCRIALDESLATLAPESLAAALRAPGLAAVILKPTLLGGLSACLELATQARAAGLAAIVTHGLEGPIGTAACAELARAIGGATPVGLAPHPALAPWSLRVPQIHAMPGAVMVSNQPGLGFGALDLEGTLATLQGDPLSIVDAADAAPTRPAVITTTTTVSFEACAGRARRGGRRSSPPTRTVIATPTLETLAELHAALDEYRPIALLHAKLPAAELARQRAEVERTELPPDAAAVLYTSGSTGTARGVVLSRNALVAAAAASSAHLGWWHHDRWLLALSLAHAGGLAVAVRCLAARRPVVLVEDPATLGALFERCTLASLVPTQLASLLADDTWRPPAELRAVLLGGAAAPPALLARAAARGVPVLPTYGMTETFGQVATADLARAGDPTAPLLPLPGVTFVAGTRETPAPIRVRGPMLATSYLDPAAVPIAPELTTADLGFLEDDAIYVIGRADDVIITGGENVHPETVEAVLAATPGVRTACVFGVPDDRWGHLVGAAVTVDTSFDRAAAIAHWHIELPPHARPRELAVTQELPVLPTGKIDRGAAARIPRTSVRYP